MSRFIDADELIELVRLQKQDALDGATITNKTIFKQKASDCENFIELIQEMPTAFDLDAVVERLEEESSFFGGKPMGTLQKHFYCEGIKRAIAIVKEGAV